MDPNTSLVIGIVVVVLSLPAIVSAFSDGRTPRVAAITLILGGGLMVYAINDRAQTGNPYKFSDLPRVVYSVIGDILG